MARADDTRPQFNEIHASRWRDHDAARSYKSRPPYPDETFDALERLIIDAPRVVLDVGCGTGKIARPLAPRVDRIDAIDLAVEMLAEARLLPGGDGPNISWRAGRAEDAPLDPPYALAVGGESLHWMDHHVLLPRLARALTPNGVLAVASVDDTAPAPWRGGLLEIVKRHSTAKNYVPFDMLRVWEEAGVYTPRGEHLTAPIAFTQTVEDFIDAHHAMSTLTRAHTDAEAFDAEMRALLEPHYPDGVMTRDIRGRIAWGRPHAAG